MNTDYRKPLGDSGLDYFDAQAAINNLEAGAYARLPYTSKVPGREPSTTLRAWNS